MTEPVCELACRLSRDAWVRLTLTGPVTQEAIDKLIALLALMRDTFPALTRDTFAAGESTAPALPDVGEAER